jgi:hypothetical protein
MRAFNKLLSICAGALFLASFVFAFLGADSIERPATLPLLSASNICLIAGVIFLIARVGFALGRSDASVHPTA